MLNDDTLPATFRTADQASLRGQALTVRAIKWSLIFIVVAAVLGLVPWKIDNDDINLTAGFAGAAFVVSLLLNLGLEKSRSQERWFAGRAVAESARSLAWRYTTGGDPFPLAEGDPDDAFGQQIIEARTRAHGLFPHGAGSEITDEMRVARSLPLDERQRLYVEHRIDDQIDWYTAKSEANGKKATLWRRIGAVANVFGVAVAVLQFFTTFGGDYDLLGLAAAATGAATAWTQTRQHVVLQAAYGDAAIDLANARERLGRTMSEEEWAEEVGTAEEAISREHTMWIARTSSVELGGP